MHFPTHAHTNTVVKFLPVDLAADSSREAIELEDKYPGTVTRLLLLASSSSSTSSTSSPLCNAHWQAVGFP